MEEERDLKPGKIIYIDIISQKKPSYGGSKNWVLIQDCDTKQKWYSFTKTKELLSEKVDPFLKEIKTMEKKAKIICCDKPGETRISKTLA